MTKVTEFDSTTEAPPRVETKHIIDALAVDPMVAGDSYVRWAKTRWRGLMDVLNATRVEGLPGAAHPLWTLQHSVCISIHDKDTREESISLLEDLMQDMGEDIIQIRTRHQFTGRPKLVLVGALSARLFDLGGGFFNFSIKQQITVGK